MLAVFGLTVGLPLVLTVVSGRMLSFDFGQRRLLNTVAAEGVAVALLWPWLASRGWAFRRIAGAPVPFDIVRGLGLAALAYLAYYFSALTWAAFLPGTYERVASASPTGTASASVVLLVCLVNPVVEEFLWLAYGFTSFDRFGRRRAVIAAVGLRTAIHVYQGVLALMSIVPLGLVFTIYYARTKRLWPTIVAHMLFDTIALSAVIRR